MESRFPPTAFSREDETDDGNFYREARLVTHIDDYAIAAVGEAYRRFLDPGGEYLDLMSSWVSHFPDDFEMRGLVGLGMNAMELERNPRLTERIVQDLNKDSHLPFEDNRFDGVLICVSVQYLTQPVAVFAEIGRVLKPGAPLIVTFSNRCFPTKAVRIWLAFDDAEHADLVGSYMEDAGVFEEPQTVDLSPAITYFGLPDDPALRRRIARREVQTDPLYAVVGVKKSDSD